MQLAAAVEHLRRIFADPNTAALELIAAVAPRAREMIWRWHLPLLLLTTIAAILSPLSWIFSGGPGWKMALAPALTACGAMLASMAFDRLLLYGQHPVLENLDQPPIENVALYLQLPALSLGLLAVVHPLLGLMGVVAGAAYCLWLAVGVLGRLYHRSAARILTSLIGALVLLMLPLLLFLLLTNLISAVRLWRAFS
ncbi:MAG: hypothetical protein K1X75_12925 [Leptospirales bacterium]|nr:hypothetical protein [Leptospirales bacterium]